MLPNSSPLLRPWERILSVAVSVFASMRGAAWGSNVEEFLTFFGIAHKGSEEGNDRNSVTKNRKEIFICEKQNYKYKIPKTIIRKKSHPSSIQH